MRDVANSSVPSHVPPTFDLDNAGISYSSVITLFLSTRPFVNGSPRTFLLSGGESREQLLLLLLLLLPFSLTSFVINSRRGILARFDPKDRGRLFRQTDEDTSFCHADLLFSAL